MKLYIASKVTHQDHWKELRFEWKKAGIDVCSSWIDTFSLIRDDDPMVCDAAWAQNFHDVEACDVLMIVGEKNPEVTGHLRGALVEAGAALALKKPVIAVYDCEDFGTWKYYQRVHHVDSLVTARSLLESWMKVGTI